MGVGEDARVERMVKEGDRGMRGEEGGGGEIYPLGIS